MHLRTMHIFRRDLKDFVPTRDLPGGFDFGFLPSEQLASDPTLETDFHARQVERLARFGESFAYGIVERSSGRLASSIWLIPYTHMPRDRPALIRPRAGEVELTAAETQPDFRGRGLYSVIIDKASAVARDAGFKRLWLKTQSDNHAALASFAKLALDHVGDVRMLRVPGTSRIICLPFRSGRGI